MNPNLAAREIKRENERKKKKERLENYIMLILRIVFYSLIVIRQDRIKECVASADRYGTNI